MGTYNKYYRLCFILLICKTIADKFPCKFEKKCTCSYTKQGFVKASCEGIGLTSIPKIPNDVNNISFSYNNISKVENGTFINNFNMMYLDLSRNNITKLFAGSFNGLMNLKALILNNNNLRYKEISRQDIFEPLTNIKYLDMKNCSNEITELNISTLVYLETLKIDFVSNGEALFGAQFKNLTHIQNLDVSGFTGYCMMKTLTNRTFMFFKGLRKVDISRCRINSVWRGTFKILTRLEYLDVSGNRCLELKGLNNITYDLPFTLIKIVKANKIRQTFALNILISKCDIQNLRQTNVSELHFDSNRIQLIEPGALDLLPKTLRILSVADNSFSWGDYILDIYKTTVQSVNVSFMSYSHLLADRVEQCDKTASGPSICNSTELAEYSMEHGISPDLFQSKIFPIFVPYQLRKFYFKQSKLRYYIPKVRLSNNRLEYIDASYNTFYYWKGPVLHLYRLQYVDLSYNFCSNVSFLFFTGLPNVTTLLIENNFLGFVLPYDTMGKTFEPLIKLRILNLADNRIPSLPITFFKSQKELRKLNLSGNMLEHIEFEIKHMPKLSLIDLSNNRLASLDSYFTKQLDLLAKNRHVTIDISGNPITCSCDTIKFVEWMTVTKVRFSSIFHKQCRPLKLYLNNTKAVYDILKKKCSSYTSIVVSVSLGLILFLLIVAIGLIYRFRWKLSYLYYMVKSKRQGYAKPINDTDFKYDVFVSYADEDSQFVHSKFLVNVEEEGKYKCCIHKRDFLPGKDIATNVTSAIHNCRKMVVIMSNNFLASDWCMFEYNMARMESIYSRKNENMIFIIFLEQILPKNLPLIVLELVQCQSYIEYTHDEYGEVVFWERIRNSLSS